MLANLAKPKQLLYPVQPSLTSSLAWRILDLQNLTTLSQYSNYVLLTFDPPPLSLSPLIARSPPLVRLVSLFLRSRLTLETLAPSSVLQANRQHACTSGGVPMNLAGGVYREGGGGGQHKRALNIPEQYDTRHRHRLILSETQV